MQPATRPESAPPSTCLLALDSSTERLSVAVQAPGQALHGSFDGGAQASAQMLPQVAAMLAQAGIGYAALDAIAFGRGPGAFTGLRTACAVAQGIALALGKPVLPIDSLLIVAEDARAQLGAGGAPLRVAVAMDARMDELYAGVYAWDGHAWQVEQAPALHSPATLAQAWQGLQAQAVAGSALAVFGERLPALAAVRLLPDEQARSAALLRLAVLAAQAGAGLDAAQALPLYLRDKVAQTTAERAAAKASAPMSAPLAG